MPRSHGEGHVHISQFDYIYQHNSPLAQFTPPKRSADLIASYKKIGKIISTELIEDGCTIQAGMVIYHNLYLVI